MAQPRSTGSTGTTRSRRSASSTGRTRSRASATSKDNAIAAVRETFEAQQVPVRLYESDGRLMVAAPMPGLEPQDISITISGPHVTIHGHLRGPHQDELFLHAAEWQVGPYHRELTLPHPVDPARTNATYGNGVLVLVCPKAPADRKAAAQTLDLTPVAATRGLHVGHAGRDMHQASTGEHLASMAESARRAGSAGRTRPPRGQGQARAARSARRKAA